MPQQQCPGHATTTASLDTHRQGSWEKFQLMASEGVNKIRTCQKHRKPMAAFLYNRGERRRNGINLYVNPSKVGPTKPVTSCSRVLYFIPFIYECFFAALIDFIWIIENKYITVIITLCGYCFLIYTLISRATTAQ